MKYAVPKAKSCITLSSIVFSFTLSAFSFLTSARAKVLPATARLIPPETVLLVNVDDFSRLRAQFEKTNLYKLYKDPAMSAFVEDFKTKWRQKTQKVDNELFRTIVGADVFPQGRAAVALVFDEQSKEANEPPALFITQWGENTSKIKEAVGKMAKKAVEGGSHQKTEDYRGVSIKTIINNDSSMLNYCFIDDCLIGSVNLDVVKFVIAHIKGATSPTLADDADYTAVIKATGPYHDIDFYVNIRQIVKTIIAEDSTGKARTTMANLGLDNVTSLGCSLGPARYPGGSSRGKALLKINGAKKGICKMLETESAVIRAPRFIPASAYSVSFFNLNIKKAYNELYNILYSSAPIIAAAMNLQLLPPSPDGQPGLQLKSNIIDHLGSQIIIAQSTSKPFSTGSAPTESLFALAVVNHRALEKSLSLLHSKIIAPSNPEASRELLGHTIYLVGLPGLPFFPTGKTPMQGPAELGLPQMPKLAFTITDTHLIFGVESTVEQAIRTLSGTKDVSVRSAKWFTSAKDLAMPSVVGLACLQDNVASGELFWWMMKEGKKALWSSAVPAVGPASIKFSPQGFSELVDFSLLPRFDAVRKYFGSSAFYGISRPDGFFFEFRDLNPADTD